MVPIVNKPAHLARGRKCGQCSSEIDKPGQRLLCHGFGGMDQDETPVCRVKRIDEMGRVPVVLNGNATGVEDKLRTDLIRTNQVIRIEAHLKWRHGDRHVERRRDRGGMRAALQRIHVLRPFSQPFLSEWIHCAKGLNLFVIDV